MPLNQNKRIVFIALLILVGIIVFFTFRLTTNNSTASIKYPSEYQSQVELALNGNKSSQFTLANLNETGKVVPLNIKEAIRWHELAAAQGEKRSQRALGNLLLNGHPSYSKRQNAQIIDVDRGLTLLKKHQYNHMANYNLARYYLKINNTEHALALLEKSANMGNTKAMNMLGELILDSDQLDKKNALIWFTKAAEKYSPQGRYNLARLYESGQIVSKDLAKASLFYIQAADLGHLSSMFIVAKSFELGTLTPKDKNKANQYLQKACTIQPENSNCI